MVGAGARAWAVARGAGRPGQVGEKRQAEAECAIVDALADVPIDFAGQITLHVHIAADGTVTVERPSEPAS